MQTTTHPTPAAILQMGSGFWASKILLTAVNFELFTHLAKQPNQSAKNLKSILDLKCSDRNLYDFLDCLTGFGFLNREGLMETALYSNSIDTDVFLDKAKPSYIGGILEMMNNRLWKFWGHLVDLHKDWMIRSYVITFAFVTFRLAEDILVTLEIGSHVDVITLMSWACWAIPLFIAEVFIQGRKINKK